MGDRRAETEAGDHGLAFGRLVEPQLDRVYRLATVILGDRAEAEDAVHDAALRAWRHFGDLRDPGRFDAWFTRIVVNACRDRIGARRVRALTVSDPDAGYAPDHVETLVRHDTLERAIRSLSPEHRVVVALRYVGDYSIEEIGVRTGERTGTVKSRLHYALRAMRAAIEAEAREVVR